MPLSRRQVARVELHVGWPPSLPSFTADLFLLREKRKKSGVGSNFCIHKYFFERSHTWQTVLAEEAEANAIDALKAELDEDVGLEDDASAGPSTLGISFEPIDTRHLSSTPLVRARVVKLLKSSPHNMHTMHNLLTTIVGGGYFHRRSVLTSPTGVPEAN